jgi:ubiquinone/menaquinone biosynthesis C-methylase UbiE
MVKFVNPTEVLNKIKLKSDMIAADFGCGSGGWVIPLAKKLEQGRVYAIDIQEEPLSALGSKLKVEGIQNVKKILSDIEIENGSKVQALSCDLVLMTNLLFQTEKKKQVFKEADRILKPRGKILVVDWKPEAFLGPEEGRVSPEEVEALAEGFKLKLKKEFSAGDYHYGLVFEKD